MEVILSRKGAKSRTRGPQLHSTGAKARVGGARKTPADLKRQLKGCRREATHTRERLVEAIKQQNATSEMLRIISNAPVQSVLDSVVENAARLCDSNNAEIRDRVIGRAACDRRTVHVHDLASEDSEYPMGSMDAKREGHRTTLATPLLREGSPIGVILIRRWEVRPFNEKQIALLETTEQSRTKGVLVAVRDSGPGIDPDHLERVFEAFHTTKPGGMGMGLSICRSIIDAHKGRLWIEANEPRGAIFQFTLRNAKKELMNCPQLDYETGEPHSDTLIDASRQPASGGNKQPHQ
jgi:hypothetical protein